MKKSIAIGIFAVSAALAQPPGPPPGRMGFGGRGGPAGMAFNRLVTGVPFSGVEVSSSQQVLANGNVINRQTQRNLFRDNQGRTREEINMTRPDGTTVSHVTIHDPVAGVMRDLNPQTKTAHEARFRVGAGPGGRGPGGATSADGTSSSRAMRAGSLAADPNVTTESLGTQTINGVSATGTRITHTIPAGAEGNSLPIQVVHETWVSDELKVPVMVKHSDPRTGTTTTQLTNIVRAEPDATLFTVPPGYTVQTGGPGRGPGAFGRGARGGNVQK